MLLDATNNICTDVEILNVLTIVKSIIEFVTIVVPVILTVFIMVDIIKTIASQDVDSKKLFKSISKRAIAAVIIFLIPFILQLVLSIIPDGKFKYLDCYENAEKETVELIASNNAAASLTTMEDTIALAQSGSKTYNDAYVAYEQARKDVKLVPNDSKRKAGFESRLRTAKEKLASIKK